MGLCYLKGFPVLYVQRSLSFSFNPQLGLELAWVFSPFPLPSFLGSSLRGVCVGGGGAGGGCGGYTHHFPEDFIYFQFFLTKRHPTPKVINTNQKRKQTQLCIPTEGWHAG